MKAQTYKFFALSQALSAITHMSGTEGNEGILMRKPVATPSGEICEVPMLTGNALRHAIREVGGKFLIDQLGLSGATDKRPLNFLLHGGDRTEKGRLESLGRQARMYELFPFLKFFAGSIPQQIMKGMSKVWFGWLVCEETRQIIAKSLPKGWELDSKILFPAEHFIGSYQIVRGDVEFSAPEYLAADRPPTPIPSGRKKAPDDNRAMTSGQSVITGSYFAHGYHLEHAYLRDVGCLLHCLSLWQHSGGRIGGKSASGHGRLKTQIHIEPEVDIPEAIQAYLDHVAENIEACQKWLQEAFSTPVKEEKPKAEKKAKPKATKEVTVIEPAEGSLWQ